MREQAGPSPGATSVPSIEGIYSPSKESYFSTWHPKSQSMSFSVVFDLRLLVSGLSGGTRAMNIFSAALGPQGVILSALLRSAPLQGCIPHKASLLCVQVCSSGLLSTSTRQKLVASNVRLYLCHMSPSVVPVFHLPTLQWWAEQQAMQSKEDELLCLTAVWFSSVSFELFFSFFERGVSSRSLQALDASLSSMSQKSNFTDVWHSLVHYI